MPPALDPSIARRFSDISEKELSDLETSTAFVTHLGAYGGFGWDELLKSRRILIVSEAGVGKTFECRQQQQSLWRMGEAAFFVELSSLASTPLPDLLTSDGHERFQQWLRAQSDTATFFLDSIDELKLTLGSFEQALKRLNRGLAGQFGRARIVITTRPIPVDRQLIGMHLPIPEAAEAAPTAEAFADLMMPERQNIPAPDQSTKAWRSVRLLPLTTVQIRALAASEGVSDPDALLNDIRERHAEEFAQRPQDLIELCANWRAHHRIGSHREQVEANVDIKLKPRTTPPERTSLSPERALEGASRLALAASLTRRLTLRHNAESDRTGSVGAALDTARILFDWTPDERETLLERPLFGFASYGRVRFHHRSVIEYLAATRLDVLISRRMPMSTVKRLLFTETLQSGRIVRPSMRPVAAWLSLKHRGIYEQVRDCEPQVLLDYGDPQSLSAASRIELLRAFCARFGKGGWRGLNIPDIQVHRFACAELDPCVQETWRDGIGNHEVRELLLDVIAAARLGGCAAIALEAAFNPAAPFSERISALDALIALGGEQVQRVADALAETIALLPRDFARSAILRLFPRYLTVTQLCASLAQLPESERAVGGLSWQLPRLIESAGVSAGLLDELREKLTTLVTDAADSQPTRWPPVQTKRRDLVPALGKVCSIQLREGVRRAAVLRSGVLALRFVVGPYGDDDVEKELRQGLDALPGESRATAFWADDTFLQEMQPQEDPWHRLYNVTHQGGIHPRPEQDRAWVRACLADQGRGVAERTMMLHVELLMFPIPAGSEAGLQAALEGLVADSPALLKIIAARRHMPAESADLKRLRLREQRHQKKAQRDDAKGRAAWIQFWREVAGNPDTCFAPDRAANTAWNLWTAMARAGEQSRAAGWNRRFIEMQFGKETADRLRLALMRAWREDRPTLRSERPDAERNTFLVRWQLGLAGLAAEAEEPLWVQRLSEEEARLACRYVPLELNGFPSWLDSLAAGHPAAVDDVLGVELTSQLGEPLDRGDQTLFLQNIKGSSGRVALLFAPRILTWLKDGGWRCHGEPSHAAKQRLGQAIDVALSLGNEETGGDLKQLATDHLRGGANEPFAEVWLSLLLRIDPAAGVQALEAQLQTLPVEPDGAAVHWFVALFNRDYATGPVALGSDRFSASLLLRLVRLAYRHVRPADDLQHEGSYSPGRRDHAERGRSGILDALLQTSGNEGWAAKVEMASDPLFAHFKDRAMMLARERLADEADNAALAEADVVALDQYGEAPPATRDAMFDVMRDRLGDIDDMLLQDDSPREAWALISKERIMRRELARALRARENRIYKIDQEAVTADEKETDIRLQSVSSEQQAVIELKLGEQGWSGADLRAALKDQLVAKYMAPESCRSGCLVVTVASDRHWDHPDIGNRLDFDELIGMLAEEADRLMHEMGGMIRVMVKGFDLRPRLRGD